jgi:hypothetical protein
VATQQCRLRETAGYINAAGQVCDDPATIQAELDRITNGCSNRDIVNAEVGLILTSTCLGVSLNGMMMMMMMMMTISDHNAGDNCGSVRIDILATRMISRRRPARPSVA